jgi:hypothetical protein
LIGQDYAVDQSFGVGLFIFSFWKTGKEIKSKKKKENRKIKKSRREEKKNGVLSEFHGRKPSHHCE